ncbi:hypothetical protein [Melittangium boletus]|uniref:hypothetical protein n=1 Tax=Melittangium boletus TaxID=83453 RepID=UPI003DA2D312
MANKDSGRTPNDDRSDTLNPNNGRHKDALDEHSRARNPKDPSNEQGKPRQSNPPGKGKG